MLQKTPLIGLFTFIFFLFLQPVSASDLFHHLITGRDILSTYSLPYTDTHSYTAYGEPWVAYSWGSALIFYCLYLATGYEGLSVLFALLGTTATLFLYLTLKKRGVTLYVSLSLTLLSASIICLRWPGRPELLGPLFLIALVYILTATNRPKWWLVIFFWAWGILYGSSTFLGLLTLALFIITSKLFTKKTLLLFVGCVGASLLNGYGPLSLFYIFRIPAIAPHVGEWSPLLSTMNPLIPELILFYQYPVILYLLFTFFCFTTLLLLSFSRYKKIQHFFFYLLLSLSLIAPYFTSRFLNLAPLISLPIIGFLLTKNTKRIRTASVIVILLLSGFGVFARFSIFPFGIGLATRSFPTNIASFLNKNQLHGNVYAVQELGAYLTFTNPQIKIFTDTRDDLFQPLGIFEQLQDVSEGSLPLAALLNKYNTDIIVADLPNGQSYAPLLYSSDWSLVYVIDGFMILARKELASKNHLTVYSSLDPLRIPPAKPGQETTAENEIRTIIQTSPDSAENTVRLIELLLAQNKNAEANTLLKKTDLSGFYGARTPVILMENNLLKAKVLLANNKCNETLTSLQQADALRRGALLLFPSTLLPTPLDLFMGEYYEKCENNVAKATASYRQYLTETTNPRERLRVERKLLMINNRTSQ